MVGPISDDERRVAMRRVGAGFVAVVAVSAGMTAFWSGATLPETGLVVLGGVVVGIVLLAVLVGTR